MTEHVSRWSRRLGAAMASVLLAIGPAGPDVAAQDAPITAVVRIDPIGADGLSGLALLMPATDAGTSVQVIVSDAPSGTYAVVHGGTCGAIDPAPVALLGDVSTTTQLTVANGFPTLVDGAHVLALHRGLDLASAIGCGAIPELDGVAPRSRPTQAPAAGGSFSGPLTGFSITWPAGWEPYEVIEVEAEDRIGLQNGSTSILLAARVAPGDDPQACVRSARRGLLDRLDSGSLRDLAPLTDADGTAIGGVETDRAWLAYRYVSVAEDGEADVADYFECRRSGDVRLFILHRSSPADYARDAAARAALLTGLVLPSGALPHPSVAPAPSAVPVPAEPSPTPPPTANPVCEGYASWHEGTLGRTDELAQLKSDVNTATNEAALAYDLTEFKLVLKRVGRDLGRMRLDQESEPAPPAAADAQARAVEMFEAFERAARILSEYYETSTDRFTLERANDAQSAADEAEGLFDDALVAVEGVCG